MVGVAGFEPATSASRTLRANLTALHPDSAYYRVAGPARLLSGGKPEYQQGDHRHHQQHDTDHRDRPVPPGRPDFHRLHGGSAIFEEKAELIHDRHSQYR